MCSPILKKPWCPCHQNVRYVDRGPTTRCHHCDFSKACPRGDGSPDLVTWKDISVTIESITNIGMHLGIFCVSIDYKTWIILVRICSMYVLCMYLLKNFEIHGFSWAVRLRFMCPDEGCFRHQLMFSLN